MENNNANPIKNIDEFVAKIDEMKKKDKMDLSSDQDLSIAIMNLVSLEEHFFFTGAKTGKTEYYDLINEVREMRKVLLKKIVKNPDGEIWCISKHLLAASMRLMEVANKQQTMGDKPGAYDLFGKAFNLYSLFWGLNMGVVKTDDVKRIDDDAVNKHDVAPQKRGLFAKLNELVKKAINCCIE
jgi:hypothetical protein